MHSFLWMTLVGLGAGEASATGWEPTPDAEVVAELREQVGEEEPFASPQAYAHYLAGRLAEERGAYEEAALHFRQTLLSTDRPEIWAALGRALLRAGEAEEARRALAEGVRTWPKHGELRVWLGLSHLVNGNAARAADTLEEAAALGYTGEDGLLTLVELRWRLGQREEAERVAARFAQRDEGGAKGWLLLSRLASGEEELAYLRLAVEADPSLLGTTLLLAKKEEEAGRSDAAETLWRQVLTRDPSAPEALLGLAKAALRRGDEKTAQKYLRQVFESAPDEIAARVNAAVYLEEARLPMPALDVLAVAGGQSRDPRLMLLRGMILEGQGRCWEASQSYRGVPASSGPFYVLAKTREARCVSLLGDAEQGARNIDVAWRFAKRLGDRDLLAEVARALPEVYRRAGRSEEAVGLLRREMGESPPAGMVYGLAEALQDVGDADAAVVLLELHGGAEDGEAYVFALATALERAGDPLGAVEVMERLLQQDPMNAYALNFVGYVLADHGLRLEEARRLLQRAVSILPDEPAVLDSLGWCELHRGDLEAAQELLERAVALRRDDPEVLHHLAELYRRLGRVEEARGLWEEALRRLRLDPDRRLERRISEGLLRIERES